MKVLSTIITSLFGVNFILRALSLYDDYNDRGLFYHAQVNIFTIQLITLLVVNLVAFARAIFLTVKKLFTATLILFFALLHFKASYIHG